MTFAFDLRHWRTAADLREHLTHYDPAICNWVQGITWHHTVIPTASQWQGAASVVGIKNFYIQAYAWDAGPHLFLVAGAPDPAHDGIWQATPLHMRGIHAGRCNADHWGMEIVGNYDTAPWPDAVRDLVFGATDALFDWRGLDVTATTVMGHRECLNNKTCPGAAINMDAMRAAFAAYRSQSQQATTETPTDQSTILAPPRCTQQQALSYMLARPHTNYTSADLSLVIIPAYVRVCTSVGVDPCVAIAQMIYETGNLTSYWDARPRRNPAGIGVTGEPGKGCSFADWANASIPAHIGRLLAYALPNGQGTDAQQALIAQALAVRALPDSYRGCAPTLQGLNGRWAVPGTTYGATIASIMAAIQKS